MSFANRGGSNVRNPPFVVPVQVSAKLNNYIPLFTGYVIDCILSTANKNQARGMFQQLMEQDQQAMGSAAQDLASLTEWVVEEEQLQPNQVETAIRNLVEPVVNAYLAMAVQAYPNDFGPVMSQEMANEVGRYQGELNQLKQQAQQFFNGGNSRGWGGNNNSNQNAGWGGGGGGNRASAMRGGGGGNGWNTNQNTGGGNLTNSRWDEGEVNYQTEANSNWPGNNAARRGYGGGGGDAVFADDRPRNARAARESGPASTARPRREFHDTRQPARREVAPVSPNITHLDGQNFFPARQDREWPKIINDKRLFDWVLMEDGTQLRPAYQSSWKASFNPEVPATPMYNPETHILFHMKQPDGTVVETALEREDAMNYLDHELDPKLRQVSKEAEQAREGKMAPAWQLVEQLRPQPSQPLATSEPLSDDAEAHKLVLSAPAEFLKTSSLADGIKRASLKLKVDHPGILSKGFELYVDRGVLTTVVNPDFELLFQLGNADSYKSLFHLMTEADADEELLGEVDKRIAAGITEALTQNMGLKGWSITSFRDDFGDLLAALKQDYGDAVLPHLENKALEVISRSLSHYSEKELADIRKTVGLEDDVVALVWRERSSVTRLPVSSDELKIPVDTGVMVGATEHPQMYKTLSAIFTRTEDVPFTYHGRYLATTDGVVYAVVNGYLNEEAIVVYKANFDLK